MGWKGALKTIRAAVRKAERQEKRRQRELQRQLKEHEKMEELEKASYEVEVFENYIDQLISLHKESCEVVDWEAMASASEPQKPLSLQNNDIRTQKKLDSYASIFLDRLFMRSGKKKRLLKQEFQEEKFRYSEDIKNYEEKYKDWEDGKVFAKRVLLGESDAYIEAMKEFNSFSELSAFGSSIKLETKDNKPPIVILKVHSESIIPKEIKTILRNGRLSVKTMPKGRFYEIYQDYVCSSVLRIANEALSILPIENIVITATDDLLNTSTGHLEEQAILSVIIPRKTFISLKLSDIDPSDSMRQFVHRMDFKKTKGFNPIEPLSLEDVPSQT